ncbi:universal stress protein [Gordonia sp. ABSL49_1]|uniref:universal stress protein n=1 Tax=unclassified Gordonia (in: high G+C Gram-positive bacteria) TaxID=2657482 RepID=UPI001F0E3EAB|nr:universal stress protein [Gordonia sp. ABSL49_1]MCH5644811.1 universal stress protein [Gordonia sp. ABSL49_1]
MTLHIFDRFDRWEPFSTWFPPPDRGPIVIGCNNSDASERALRMVCARFSGADVVVVTATTGRHRVGRPNAWNDALKADAYQLTDEAITTEHLRHAREVAQRAGARSVTVVSEVGDPLTVLSRVADRFDASAVVVGMVGRPSPLARALRRRLADRIEFVVTDGTTHLRPRRRTAQSTPMRPATVPQVGLAPS